MDFFFFSKIADHRASEPHTHYPTDTRYVRDAFKIMGVIYDFCQILTTNDH